MKSTVRKSDKIVPALAAFIVCALLCFAAFAGSFHAYGDLAEESLGGIVKHKTDCEYYYFDYPTAVYSASGSLYVADGAAVKKFDTYDLTESATVNLTEQEKYPDKFALLGGISITLAGGKLYCGGEYYGEFSDFTVFDNQIIYAIKSNEGQIYKITPSAAAAITAEDDSPATDGEEVGGGSDNDNDGGGDDSNNESGDNSGDDGDNNENPDEPILTVAPVLTAAYSRPFKKIAADNGGIYVTAENRLNRYLNDVIYFSYEKFDAPAECLSQSEEILGMAGRNNGVAVFTRYNITAYEYNKNSHTLTAINELACGDVVAICVDNNDVYGISSLKSVFKVNSELTERTELLASAYDETCFFRANAGLHTRRQMIAVADEFNNRVQILRQDAAQTVVIPVTRPKAVTIDYDGNIYVAHDVNKISVFSESSKLISTFSADNLGYPEFTDLKIDLNNTVYALGSNGQIYEVLSNSAGLYLNAVNGASGATAMSVSPYNDKLYYAVSENGEYKIKSSSGETKAINIEITDFCIDHDNNFYVLSENGIIYKYDDGGNDLNVRYEIPNIISATHIIMNTVEFTGDINLEYGDLLISDTGAHAVIKVGKNSGNLNVNHDFDNAEYTVPELKGEKIIYTVDDCYVYERPAEIGGTHINAGWKVVIPDFDASAPFNYILCDNPAGGNPISGYISTALINSPLSYTEPPTEACYPYLTSGVTVYKYPVMNSTGFLTVPRNTRLQLLDFAYTEVGNSISYGYSDNRSPAYIWYHVKYSDEDGTVCEGYVVSDSISMRNENPDDRNVYPRVNAEIIAKESGEKFAKLYEKDAEGNFTAISESLAVGTKVEVVGTFDSSEKYTLIKYTSKGMTLSAYVETANLKYNGINKVVVVAVVLIILTVILGAILIARFLYIKRTRKLTDSKL